MKVCTKCKLEKEKSCFYKHKRYKDGLRSVCKTCCSESSKLAMQRYLKTEAGILKNRERTKKERTWNNEKYKMSVKMSVYKSLGVKINKSEYTMLLESQNYKCAICNNTSLKKSLSLDHCHVTLKVRGFLCNSCNLALGNFKDCVSNLENAINYLRKSQKLKPDGEKKKK